LHAIGADASMESRANARHMQGPESGGALAAGTARIRFPLENCGHKKTSDRSLVDLLFWRARKDSNLRPPSS